MSNLTQPNQFNMNGSMKHFIIITIIYYIVTVNNCANIHKVKLQHMSMWEKMSVCINLLNEWSDYRYRTQSQCEHAFIQPTQPRLAALGAQRICWFISNMNNQRKLANKVESSRHYNHQNISISNKGMVSVTTSGRVSQTRCYKGSTAITSSW